MKKTLFVAALLLVGAAMPGIAQLKLNGAGATFPYVIYSKWFDVYHTKTGIEFNYQSIGSGGGIKQVTEGTVDFGATDGFMSDDQLKDAAEKQGTEVLHIPTVMGAVVVTYNLPSLGSGLRLTPEVLAGVFLGDITKWNDAKIAEINPGKQLPDLSIIVAHRSDGSGTTAIFTDYLTKVSKTWSEKVGKGPSVNWPVGLGGKGSEGVAGLVKQSEGAIGYVELAYAKSLPADLRVSITDADGKEAYPISGFTWLLVYKTMKDKEKAGAMVKFLRWAMTEGQSYAKDLYYAPLPKDVVKLCEKRIDSIEVK